MHISSEQPAILPRIVEAFGERADWNKGLIVTYGDTCHVKGGCGLTKDLVKHEMTHVRQQTEYEGGPDAWWERYLKDKEFRMQEEKEAYAIQLRCIRDEVANPRKQKPRVEQIARSLSEVYGELMTREEAIAWIKEIWQS